VLISLDALNAYKKASKLLAIVSALFDNDSMSSSNISVNH
jgi:hypothetical protein